MCKYPNTGKNNRAIKIVTFSATGGGLSTGPPRVVPPTSPTFAMLHCRACDFSNDLLTFFLSCLLSCRWATFANRSRWTNRLWDLYCRSSPTGGMPYELKCRVGADVLEMKSAALGVRMHSGWGILVAISQDAQSAELVDRRSIVTVDETIPGAKQPYHYAARLEFPESEKYLANCAALSECLALAAIRELIEELGGRHYRIVGCALLLASGRVLPALPKILASHPLLHTAEGGFFRDAVRKACEHLSIPVTAIRERELEERAKTVFGNAANRVQRRISVLGSSIGPPWTKDHKTAALAAAMVLACEERVAS